MNKWHPVKARPTVMFGWAELEVTFRKYSWTWPFIQTRRKSFNNDLDSHEVAKRILDYAESIEAEELGTRIAKDEVKKRAHKVCSLVTTMSVIPRKDKENVENK